MMKAPLIFRYRYFLFLMLLLLLLINASLHAQQLELSLAGANTSTTGTVSPATTTTNATLYQNTGTSTTFTPYTPNTTVTVSFSNQQYTGTRTGLAFGLGPNGVSSAPTTRPIYTPINVIGSPVDNYFTSSPDAATAGTNISVSNNYSFVFFVDAQTQFIANAPSTARPYFGDLTVTFNRPVINPVLHLSGMGGAFSDDDPVSPSVQGIFTEFELSTADVAAGRNLTRLSGNTNFGLDATNTKILNTNTSKSTTLPPYASTANYASGGSVRVNTGTTAVTSVTFRVYLRGDGGIGPAPVWSSSTDCAGDNVIISASLGLFGITGTVFNDNNGMTGGVNGTTMPAGTTVTLYAGDGTTVIATTTTSAGGTYSFPNVITSNYVVGVTAPAGYQHVSSTDATPANGLTSVTVATANVTANFGLNQPPTAANNSLTNQVPGSPVTVPNILANDSDPNSGTLNADSISLVAPAGATGITTDAQGDITGFTVPGQGTWSLNSSTGAVTFTPQAGFTGDPTAINYTVTDAAGLTSNAAAITIDYAAPAAISGTLFNDNNGMTGGVNGTTMPGTTVTLYASNGTTVIATTTTDASGNYSFPNIIPGNYVIGATPPAGYQHVSSTDATPLNGQTSVTVAGTTNQTGINFGLNQPPVAANDNLINQVPGSPATVANILANDSDPNSGTLNADSITLVAPAGATAVTTDAQGDVTGFTVPGQGTWSLNSSTGAVTFTPQAGFLGDPTPINYIVTDAARLNSNQAQISIDYNPPVTISGTVYNDNDGQIGGVNGNAMSGVTVTLYASDGVTVLATTTTNASGAYSFPDRIPGNYVVGVTPPAGYQHVSSTDATPANGSTAVPVGSEPVGNINFGLNQPPASTGNTLNNQIAGVTATVPNILGNDTDPNGGTLNPDSISLVLPAGATGIATDVQGDVTGFTIPGEGTWSLNSTTGAVTFTPQSGFQEDPTPINYTVTDAAGLVSNASSITIGYNPPLPVVLIYFSGKDMGQCNISLQWQTGTETMSREFEVEHSPDAVNFTGIAQVQAKGDNSRYTYEYNRGSGGVNYFRLKMVNENGSYDYSKVVVMTVSCVEQRVIKVYPTIATSTVKVEGIRTGEQIMVYDAAGRLVLTRKAMQSKEQLDVSYLPGGYYHLLLVTDNSDKRSYKVIRQ